MIRSNAGSRIIRIAKGLKPWLVCLLLAGCGKPENTVSELSRPGGGTTAILTRTEGSSLNSDGYRIYLRDDAGKKTEHLHVYDADDGPPTMHWEGPYRLVVKLSCGIVLNYDNDGSFFDSGKILHEVDVNLQLGGLRCKIWDKWKTRQQR
jgi:hypothetical protein